jgi:hypothetical protein
MNTINETLTNCMDCKAHQEIMDPNPTDWFNDDDAAVLCTLTNKNPHHNPSSDWVSDRQNKHRCITTACRPYNLRKECDIPDWCPKLEQKTPQQQTESNILHQTK